MAGVTSAVDLGGTLKESLSVRDRIRKGEIPGPRMSVSGPWITRDLGDYPVALPNQLLIDTPADAAKATEDLAKAGVDVIKAYVGLSPAHYKAIVDAAHRHKLRVHAHVYDARRRPQRLRSRNRRPAARRLRGDADLRPGARPGDRRERHAGRRHRGAPGVSLPRHGRLSRAAPGSRS